MRLESPLVGLVFLNEDKKRISLLFLPSIAIMPLLQSWAFISRTVGNKFLLFKVSRCCSFVQPMCSRITFTAWFSVSDPNFGFTKAFNLHKFFYVHLATFLCRPRLSAVLNFSLHYIQIRWWKLSFYIYYSLLYTLGMLLKLYKHNNIESFGSLF